MVAVAAGQSESVRTRKEGTSQENRRKDALRYSRFADGDDVAHEVVNRAQTLLAVDARGPCLARFILEGGEKNGWDKVVSQDRVDHC